MLGAAGALCCLAAGTALGSWMRERRMARLNLIAAELDALGGMRLMLSEERPALTELLSACAGYVSDGMGADEVAQRLEWVAQTLYREPAQSPGGAYLLACAQFRTPWEKAEERSAMERLFCQLGSGTAAMREQSVAACIRRLKPLCESARAEAQQGGKLCMQLGMLVGLMAGIVLW